MIKGIATNLYRKISAAENHFPVISSFETEPASTLNVRKVKISYQHRIFSNRAVNHICIIS